MSRKTIFQFWIVALLLSTVSCDDVLKSSWEYQIDNPLDTEIVIKIDEKEYTIPAKTTQDVKITEGKHTLTYNGSSVNFVTKANSQKSVTVMNPTLSNYMLHAYFYISEKARTNDVSALYEANSYTYNSDAGIVQLPVKVLNALFIEKNHDNWALGLDQDAKSEIRSSVPGKKKVFCKLYREAEYMEELAEELPEGIVFPVNKLKLSEQPAYVFPTESFLCDCEVANEFVRDLESRWKKMIADPSDIFQDVGRLSYDAVVETTSMDRECGEQFNPGRDDKAYKEAWKRLSREMKYLTDASSFIVE